MKFFNQWFRKIHRWITIPFVIVVILTNATRGIPSAAGFQQIQQILMLTLIISGSYLYLLPYLTKWQRARRRR